MTLIASLPAALQPWQNFYLLIGTAAATLTGLMFVAVTFGSGLVTKENARISRSFLDPTYQHFVQVLFISCLMTIPVVTKEILGTLLIAMGALRASTLRSVFRDFREAHRVAGDVELSDWVYSIILPLGCHLWVAVTGGLFILGWQAAIGSLGVATLVLLLIGIHGAWELFVWMALAISEKRDGVERRQAAPAVSAPPP